MKELIKKTNSISDSYQALLDELENIRVVRTTNARMEVLAYHWETGKAIADFMEQAHYGDNIIDTIAKDLGRSSVDLYKSVQFYKKFKEEEFEKALMKLPEGNNISWSKIVQEYLPESKKETSPFHYISCKVDDEQKVIYIPEKYNDYKIVKL